MTSTLSAIGVFAALTKLGASPRIRVIGALSSLGVSTSHIVYTTAIENSLGFNRLMYSLFEYKRTGIWPSLDYIKVNPELDKKILDLAKSSNIPIDGSDESSVKIAKDVMDLVKDGGSTYLPNSDNNISDLLSSLFDSIFKGIFSLIQPTIVEGFLDDLIGQRLFIEVILFISCIFTFLLFIIFILNIIIFINKESIINKVSKFTKNRFVNIYLKYQFILINLSLKITPFFILLGLFTITHGLFWMLSHQIPLETLDIDLHQYVSSSLDKSSLFLLCINSKIIKNKKNITPLNYYYSSESKDSKLNFYDLNNPIFNKLISILNTESASVNTQLKIENLLLNQGLEYIKKDFYLLENLNSKLVKILIDNKPYLVGLRRSLVNK